MNLFQLPTIAIKWNMTYSLHEDIQKPKKIICNDRKIVKIFRFIWNICQEITNNHCQHCSNGQKTMWPKLILFFVEVFKSFITIASPNQKGQEPQSMTNMNFGVCEIWGMWDVEFSRSLTSIMKFKCQCFFFAIRKKMDSSPFRKHKPYQLPI